MVSEVSFSHYILMLLYSFHCCVNILSYECILFTSFSHWEIFYIFFRFPYYKCSEHACTVNFGEYTYENLIIYLKKWHWSTSNFSSVSISSLKSEVLYTIIMWKIKSSQKTMYTSFLNSICFKPYDIQKKLHKLFNSGYFGGVKLGV